jgi:transcriptional regulator
MYIPNHFLQEDKSQVIGFMKQYSFATIISFQDSLPVATHLPFVIEERDEDIILISHFARANEQWNKLKQQTALVIFTEPHAYISPKHYDTELSVPTWNYAAVHAYGKAAIIPEEQKVIEVLEKTIQYYEAAYQQQWSQLPEKFKAGIIKGIVAFEITVTNLQAKYKLSQNRTDNEKKRIIESLAQSENSSEQELAEMMQSVYTEKTGTNET